MRHLLTPWLLLAAHCHANDALAISRHGHIELDFSLEPFAVTQIEIQSP